MAISVENLTASTSRVVASSYTTASITPTKGKYVIVAVQSRSNTGSFINPGISGCGITWSEIIHTTVNTSSGLTLFRGVAVSPTTDQITITYGGNQLAVGWIVDQFTGMDISGNNGDIGIVQNNTITANSDPSTGLSLNLSAFSNPGNATYGVIGVDAGAFSPTPGTNFTQVANVTTNQTIASEFSAVNRTTVDWIWSSSSSIPRSLIAVELKLLLSNLLLSDI